jgi:DNA-binding NarL/FixJ family response regulator
MTRDRSAVIYAPEPLWLDALEQVLRKAEVDVVEKTTTREACAAAVEKHRPSLLVSDAGSDSHAQDLELAERCHTTVPEMKIMLLASRTDPEAINDALRSGVSAYVFKTAHPQDVAAAIRQAFEHSVYVARPAGQARPLGTAPTVAERDAGLTPRETEILALVAQGHSNAAMAKMLWVTEQTIKFHLSNIYRKLNVANRTEASRWAHARGLVPVSASRGEADPAS